jgi:MoaA/NifB/PqqE/SkfB family radical SAM enzyme
MALFRPGARTYVELRVEMNLTILYRGPLSSCNYGCDYCPFAKHIESAIEHENDQHALTRFVNWVELRANDLISVFFTPWGEALIRSRYQHALIKLTNLANVKKAVIQTNLSCRLDWVEKCDKSKLALWTTFHPSQVARERFIARCLELDRRGVRFSVGVVGLKEQTEEIEALRNELPPHIYLWINAYKRIPDYYTLEEINRFTGIDPLFPVNNVQHPSLGESCRAGSSVISVDGEGTIRRCHFIREPIGNIYQPGFENALITRQCTRATCGCHIGYVHMNGLKLYEVFGEGVMERITNHFPFII